MCAKLLVLSFASLLLSFISNAQIIEGMVHDKNGLALFSANITIKSLKETDRIIGFSISKADGSYSIKIASTLNDTLLITVSKLGFLSKELKILPVNQTLNFTLKKGEVQLKEIIVKPPPIQRKGDTLAYNVEAFKSVADRSIGDVIKKLPGIDIDQYGRILYQGKPINRYYIEGMNMLNDRYGLINDNLPHDKVAIVEVLENHQPIRILDSLSFSDKAAINIKLKNKVTQTGVLHYGIGAKPVIYDINATPMIFVPNWQFLGSLQSNNSGRNLSNFFLDFPQSGLNLKQNWLQVTNLNTPPFTEKRYLDNLSHGGSGNILKRNKKDLEFKLNSSIFLDRFQQEGGENIAYFLNNETFGYTEIIRNSFRTNQVSLTLNLEKNTEENYLKNSLNFEQEWKADDGTNSRIDKSYKQDNKTENFKLENNFQKIFMSNNTQYNFYSFTTFLYNKQKFSVKLSGNDSTASPFQDFMHQGFSTHNYIDFSRKITKGISLGVKAGSEISLSNIETELMRYALESDTTNSFNWNNYKTYISGALIFNSQKWQVLLNLPLAYYFIEYSPHKTKRLFNKLVPEPTLNLRYRSNQNTEFFGYGMYVNTLARLGEIHSGFVMTNYLSLVQKNVDFTDNSIYNASLGMTYNNIISGFSINSSYNYNSNKSNQLPQSKISLDGSREISYSLRSNISRSHSGNIRIRKYFFSLKTSISTGIKINRSETDIFVNDTFAKYSIRSFSPNAIISFNGLKWLEFNYNTSYMYTQNINSAQIVKKYSQYLSPVLSILGTTSIRLSLEHNTINSNEINRNYIFGDILIRYTIPKTKHDFEFSLSNIFNQDTFQNITINDYFTQQTTFQLRPRQFLIKGRISF